MLANESGTCSLCNGPINIGDDVSWNRRGDTRKYHVSCKANQTKTNDGNAAAVLAAMVQPFLTVQRDEITAELEEFVSERISTAFAELPKEIKTVYIQNGQTLGTIEGNKHEQFDLVVRLIAKRKNVYLWGEAGSGKSTAAKQIAELLGLPFYYLGLQAQMTESRLMGYPNAHGEYIPTDFYRAYSTGGVFLLDELELGSGNLLGSLNGALANGHAAFPCGLTERHPDFICIATGNTPALGASIQFSDRRALDSSVRDRFHFVQWDTDETLERQLSSTRFDNSDAWVTWVRNVREFAKITHPKLTCTQRASIEGSELLSIGISPRDCANMLVFRGYDVHSVNSILAHHPLPIY